MLRIQSYDFLAISCKEHDDLLCWKEIDEAIFKFIIKVTKG